MQKNKHESGCRKPQKIIANFNRYVVFLLRFCYNIATTYLITAVRTTPLLLSSEYPENHLATINVCLRTAGYASTTNDALLS